MVLEEHQRNSSNNSSSSSRSKSKKAKKIPQRGLGVAQLEKLINEELKKKTSSSPSSSSLTSFKIPQSPPKQQPLMPSLDSRSSLSGLANIESSSSSIGFIPALEFDGNSTRSSLEQSNQIDPSGARAPLPSNISSSNIWRYGPFQRNQYYQPQMQSLHNSALPSSSGVNFQIEPPSNQIYSTPFVKPYGWAEEERNLDSNSQWPLHPYPLTAFTTTLPLPLPRKSPFFFPSDPRNTDFREDVLSSGTHPRDMRNSDSHISKRLRESSTSTTDDGFLTLSSSSMSRPILPDQHCDADLLLSRSNGGINHGLPRCVDDLLPPPFYNFMPPAPANTGEPNSKDGSGEASNGVDTDLKLG